MAEPTTATVVASLVGMELLKGGIGFLGGELFRSVLGYPSINDVRLWIREAVAELKIFVSEELRRQLDDLVLEEMEADLSATITNLHHYASLTDDSRKENKFLLDKVVISTASLVPKSLPYDQAYFVTTTAIAYRFLALCALYKDDNDAGHIKQAKPMVDNVVRQLGLSRKRLSHEMSPEAHFDIICEFNNVKETDEFDKDYLDFGSWGGRQIVSCFGTKDGKRVTDRYNSVTGKITKYPHELGLLKRDVEVVLKPLITPMKKQAQEFTKSANTSISLVINCYDLMCQAIGSGYTPPEDAEPLLNIEPLDIQQMVEMPGAKISKPIK